MVWQNFAYPLIIVAVAVAVGWFVLLPMIRHFDKKNKELATATPSGSAFESHKPERSYERRPLQQAALQDSSPPPSVVPADSKPLLALPSPADVSQVLTYPTWILKLLKATHVFLSGGKGAGKTTFAWMLMRVYASQGYKFIFIDPHHRKGEMGDVRPHAAGRRFYEAARVFRFLIAELDRRYKERSDNGVERFERIMLVCDEFDALTNKKTVDPEIAELAASFFSMLGDESRKVDMGAIFIAHGMEVKNLGIEGKGSKRDNYAAVLLTQGPDEKPEPTGQLVIGSGEWEIDTRSVKSKVDGWKPTPEMVYELPALLDGEQVEEPVYTADQVRMMLQTAWFMADHRHTQKRKTWSYRSVGSALFDGQNEGENFYTTKKLVASVSTLLEQAGIIASAPVSSHNTQKQPENNTPDNTDAETLAALLTDEDVKPLEAKAA